MFCVCIPLLRTGLKMSDKQFIRLTDILQVIQSISLLKVHKLSIVTLSIVTASILVQAALTNYQRLESLNKNFYFPQSGGWKLQDQGAGIFSSGESHSMVYKWLSSLHILPYCRERQNTKSYTSSFKGTNLMHEAAILKT